MAGEHTTAKLKRKPGKRANVQAHVAVATTPKGRPQHANDNYGPRAPGGAGSPGQTGGATPS